MNEALEDYPEAQKILQRKAKYITRLLFLFYVCEVLLHGFLCRKLMKQNTKRETIAREEAQGTQIIGHKPPTPKFVRAVIQVISNQFFA